MYDLCPASCPCNFPLYSGVLASLMEVFYWPGTDQPAINQRASHAFAPPSVASQLLNRWIGLQPPKSLLCAGTPKARESAGLASVDCQVDTLAIECALRETLVEALLGDDICVCS